MSSILTIVGIAAAAFVGTKLLVKGDNRVENRRGGAVTLSGWAQANGLPIIAQMLKAYAIGDYSGVLFGLRQAQDLVGDSDAREQAVATFLNLQLAKQVATADGREALIAKVEKLLNVVIDRTAIAQAPVAVTSAGEKPK